MKTKIAYVAASIAALTLPVLALSLPMAGCGNTAPSGPVEDATPGTEGGGSVPETGTQQGDTGATTPPDGGGDAGYTLVPLTTTGTGYVSPTSGSPPNTVNVTGSWYAYGDGWGTLAQEGGVGAAGERGNCELIGGFPPPPSTDCSTITSPAPAAPQVDAGAVAVGDAASDATATASEDAGNGYDNGFPPTPSTSQTFCLSGVAAKVIPKPGSTADDYSDIFGIGLGFDFNNIGGVKAAYDATLNKVVGVQFTLTSGGTFPPTLRVEFPTGETLDGGPTPTGDSYDIAPTKAGTYTVLWSQLETPFPPVVGTNISYAPTVDGGIAAQPKFDPTQLFSIQFHVATNTTAAIPVDNLCVGNLTALVQK